MRSCSQSTVTIANNARAPPRLRVRARDVYMRVCMSSSMTAYLDEFPNAVVTLTLSPFGLPLTTAADIGTPSAVPILQGLPP